MSKKSNASDKATASKIYPLNYERFLEIASQPTTADCRYPESVTQTRNLRWAEGVSYEDSIQRLKLGWPEGVAKAKQLASKLESRLTAEFSFDRDITFNTTGEWFDIGRVLEGEPDCWGSEIELDDQLSNDKRGKVVKVVVNVACSCHYDADEITRRGVYALAIVDLLERIGKSVELVVSCKLEKNGKIWGWELPLKKAGEELSLDRVSQIIGAPSGFRRSWFRVITHTDFPDCGSSLGHPTDWTEDELKERNVDIYIGALMSGATEWQGATDTNFIIRKLKEAGINVEQEDAKV